MSAGPPSTHHDVLTGLPNRRLLDDRLAQALHLAQRRDAPLAVMLLALGGLAVPDDARLADIARRLAACVRRSDTLARYGAAEFALVLCDVRGAADANALLRNAEAALYQAREGREALCLYR